MIYIKDINGEFYPNIIDDVRLINNVSGEIQLEDYINLNKFTAYLQDLKNVEYTSLLTTPLEFGLKNTYNNTMITLEISY